ncbi:MAG TPA: hypothetical protein PKD79_03985 [Candidatus Doudnabacteria bacterium]|nr:hypothetical protein [Candidatus Doudnabacteria bacterium]
MAKKIYETRAATTKYRHITIGDKLEISCGSEKIIKKVTKVAYFTSIDKLLKAIPLKKIMPDVGTVTKAKQRWYSYPNYKEKIKENGIIAFLLK